MAGAENQLDTHVESPASSYPNVVRNPRGPASPIDWIKKTRRWSTPLPIQSSLSEAYTATIVLKDSCSLAPKDQCFTTGAPPFVRRSVRGKARRAVTRCLSGQSSDPIALAVCESEAAECATPARFVDTPGGRIDHERRRGLKEVVVQTVNVANGQSFMQLLAVPFTCRYSHAVPSTCACHASDPTLQDAALTGTESSHTASRPSPFAPSWGWLPATCAVLRTPNQTTSDRCGERFGAPCSVTSVTPKRTGGRGTSRARCAALPARWRSRRSRRQCHEREVERSGPGTGS